jgi:predicted nucleotidyltransferase
MSFTVAIQFVLDVVFLGAVYCGFLFVKNDIKFRKDFEKEREEQDRLRKEWTDRLEELNQLSDSLDNLVTEALKVSDKINKGVEVKKNETADLMDRMDEEKRALAFSMDELNSVAAELKRKPEARKILGDGDRYADALKLAKKGYSAEEISKKIKMPLGEIELALSLRKGDD